MRRASLIRHFIPHSKPKCNFSLINNNIHVSLSLCKQTSCWGMRNWKMSFSGKHDPQDSQNYIHYFNCLKEQFIAHCWCLQQLQCMESVIASLSLFISSCFLEENLFSKQVVFFGRLFKTCLSITYELFKTTEPIIQLTVAVHVQR